MDTSNDLKIGIGIGTALGLICGVVLFAAYQSTIKQTIKDESCDIKEKLDDIRQQLNTP